MSLMYESSYLNNNKTVQKRKKAKRLAIFGWLAVSFGLVYVLLTLTGNLGDAETAADPWGTAIMMLVVFGVTGLVLLIVFARVKRECQFYTKYVRIVSRENSLIDNIAFAVGVTSEIALNDWHTMVASGFFPGCHVDEIGRKVMFPEEPRVSVVCKSDGAVNSIPVGRAAKCAYCAELLKE